MPGSGNDLAWFMLASHNLSGGAWGKLRKNGSELHIMHYEVRILSYSKFKPCRSCGETTMMITSAYFPRKVLLVTCLGMFLAS